MDRSKAGFPKKMFSPEAAMSFLAVLGLLSAVREGRRKGGADVKNLPFFSTLSARAPVIHLSRFFARAIMPRVGSLLMCA